MGTPPKIVISESGPLEQAREELVRRLREHPGQWCFVVVSGDLVVLEREHPGTAAGGRTVLAGRVTGEGHLLDVIGCISTSRWSGRLVVSDGEISRELYFSQGALRMATSNDPSDRLGEVMYRLGMISRRQLDEALAGMGPDQRIGEILVERGATTAHRVYETIHEQVESLFFAAIDLQEGTYVFEDGVEMSELPAYISLDTNNLMMEAVRRSDELKYFRRLIPSMRILLKRKSRSIPPGAEPDERTVFLSRCDGRSTLEQVAEELGLGEYEAMRMAHRLLSEGALEVIPTESAGQDSIRYVVDRFNDMIGVVNQAIHVHGDTDRFLRDARSYTSYGGEFEDFISQLELDDTGHLQYENVVEILGRTEVRDRMSYLVQVLTQYLFYMLFLADNHLPRDRHSRISAEVHTMLQKIGE
jgi:hypothetical protein